MSKARTARKKAVKPRRMHLLKLDGRMHTAYASKKVALMMAEHFFQDPRIKTWEVIAVLVTPAHKGKP